MAASNRVRIGGGEWRSRMLAFPDVPGLRPTPDRVRQTVFNWLGQELNGLTCLDLFSGTGVMGFEALSRGADKVVMVEKSSAAYFALQANRKLLQSESAQIYHMDALQFLKMSHPPFDIIFLDPPYNQGWLPRLLPQLQQHLKADGWLYVEAEYAIKDSEPWQVVKQGKAGNVFFHLLKLADIANKNY
ncbi:MAG: 16S rRNA (guanine(966)-N(2))-methyltransferase RsmD [Methylophilaceae bacterium]|nr:16S rRNA (guanine(966)-N(2))-methyltransferase RsmD [Methylophilaceae bacterium]